MGENYFAFYKEVMAIGHKISMWNWFFPLQNSVLLPPPHIFFWSVKKGSNLRTKMSDRWEVWENNLM